MNRVLKVALLCGLAVTVASCGTVRRVLPFGLGAPSFIAPAAYNGSLYVLTDRGQLVSIR